MSLEQSLVEIENLKVSEKESNELETYYKKQLELLKVKFFQYFSKFYIQKI